jgi:hypothetical protein
MITDAFNTFSNAQTIAATGTTASTNTIDLSAPRDIGAGRAVKIYFDVTTSFSQSVAGGSVVLEVVADTSPLFNATPTVLNSTTVAVTALVASAPIFVGNLNFEPYAGERYLQAQYIVQNTTLTAGAISSGLVVDAQADEYYPSGINVVGV